MLEEDLERDRCGQLTRPSRSVAVG